MTPLQLAMIYLFMVIPLKVYSLGVAWTYLYRLIRVMLHKGTMVRFSEECFALWVLPLFTVTLYAIYPPGTIGLNLAFLSSLSWTFAVFCAILRSKIERRLTWRDFGGDSMKRVVAFFDWFRRILLSIGKLWDSVSLGIKAIAYGVSAVIFIASISIMPLLVIPTLTVFYLIFFFVGLHSCIHSCKNLLIFWFYQSLLIALTLCLVLSNSLPNAFANPQLAYYVYILLYTFFWLMSAGVAEYEVAKMACSIVNTSTTILLLLFNVAVVLNEEQLLASPLFYSIDPDTLLYLFPDMINLVLFPFVASGYLAALFNEGLEYAEKRIADPTLKAGNDE